ncbi:hypothetical protein [Rhizobium leguminosarum]
MNTVGALAIEEFMKSKRVAAPAEAALAAEVEQLANLLKTAADFLRGMPSDCMGIVKGEEHDFCAEPDHFVKDEFLHYVDAALAQQKQEGGE